MNGVPYGFYTLRDIYDNRVIDVDIEVIDEALRLSAEQHTEDINARIETLAEFKTGHQDRVELPSTGYLQPLGEHGIPEVTRTGEHYTRGYPMWRAGDAYGGTREAWVKMTVQDLAKITWNKQIKDAKTIKWWLMATLFTNVDWTYNDEKYGDTLVRSAAKASDGAIYLDVNGELIVAEHYTGQAAGIADATNPYKFNRDLLKKHPSNVGTIVHYINSALRGDTELLSGFYEGKVAFVDYGISESFANEAANRFLGFGSEIIGVTSDGVIVEDNSMPADMVVSIAVEAEVKPLRFRQEPEAELQGFRSYTVEVNSNYRRVDYYRKGGFGVQNPVAFAIRRVGNASYAIPAGFDARKIRG